MSTKILAALFALAVGASLIGCRTAHLGDDHGRAYRRAFDGQADHAAQAQGPPLSAEDARNVITVHRQGGKPSTAPGPAAGGGSTTTTTAPAPSSSGAAWPGASGPISLEAK